MSNNPSPGTQVGCIREAPCRPAGHRQRQSAFHARPTATQCGPGHPLLRVAGTDAKRWSASGQTTRRPTPCVGARSRPRSTAAAPNCSPPRFRQKRLPPNGLSPETPNCSPAAQVLAPNGDLIGPSGDGHDDPQDSKSQPQVISLKPIAPQQAAHSLPPAPSEKRSIKSPRSQRTRRRIEWPTSDSLIKAVKSRDSYHYCGFGQFRCLCKKSNVWAPLILCGPTKYSIWQRPGIFNWTL